MIAKEYWKELNKLRRLKNQQIKERYIAIYSLKRVSALSNRGIGVYFNIPPKFYGRKPVDEENPLGSGQAKLEIG